MPEPRSINGVAQRPIEGVSILYTFDAANASAPSRRRTQYFEMFGNYALYHEGWSLVDKVTRPSWVTSGPADTTPDKPEWELYDLTKDWSQNNALAAAMPEKVKEHSCILGRSVKAADRTKFCDSKKILIATYAMCKEGFDVATLNTLVMATPRPDVDQIVGRIMRTEKTTRTVDPLIVDIVDPAFRRQFQERLRLYKERNYIVEKMTIE